MSVEDDPEPRVTGEHAADDAVATTAAAPPERRHPGPAGHWTPD